MRKTLVVTMLVLAAWGATQAQEFPAQPIRMVIPYAPGGGSDILTRPVAQEMQDKLKQSVIVDNRGGAGGNMGAQMVARAAPDGYTLLVANNSHTINSFIYKEPGYDMAADFAPISHRCCSTSSRASTPRTSRTRARVQRPSRCSASSTTRS